MSEPVYTCKLCYRQVEVADDGRGFPPGIARRKLQNLCRANDCPCDPQYTAGVSPELEHLLENLPRRNDGR